MSFLVALWIIALLILAGVVVYAHMRPKSQALPSSGGASDLSRMMAGEILEMGGLIWNKTLLLRPHGERVISEGVVLWKRGHNLLVEKAFGRVMTEKGKTSSFFLKRIAEIKEVKETKGTSNQNLGKE